MYSSHSHQHEVLALQLATNSCPVRLSVTATVRLGLAVAEQLCLKHLIGHVVGQRSDQAGGRQARPDSGFDIDSSAFDASTVVR